MLGIILLVCAFAFFSRESYKMFEVYAHGRRIGTHSRADRVLCISLGLILMVLAAVPLWLLVDMLS